MNRMHVIIMVGIDYEQTMTRNKRKLKLTNKYLENAQSRNAMISMGQM